MRKPLTAFGAGVITLLISLALCAIAMLLVYLLAYNILAGVILVLAALLLIRGIWLITEPGAHQ